MSSTYTSELPSNFDFESLSKFFDATNSQNYIDEKERELWIVSGASGGTSNKGKINCEVFKRTYQNDFFNPSFHKWQSSLFYNSDDYYLNALEFFRKNQKKSFIDAQIDGLQKRVEKARSRWACISAISQREKKTDRKGDNDSLGRFDPKGHYEVKSFAGVTQINPKYERVRPISGGREAGEVVCTFSKRSRQRMLSKARKMNKEGMSLPFFVTLTYQENMKNFKGAKKHLNAFFQRFRRLNKDFAYFWKMEPQKRGAIHFHLAFFPPSGWLPKKWVNYIDKNEICDVYVEYVRLRVSSAWNEITCQCGYEKEDRGDPLKDESGDYKWDEDFFKRTKSGSVYGNLPLLVGTNVKTVENWKMFTGYVGKYMKKEVGKNPWDEGKKILKRHEIKTMAGKKCVPVVLFDRVNNNRMRFNEDYFLSNTGEIKTREKDGFKMEVIEREKRALHTGRWWGFSRNIDFEAIQSGVVDGDELKSLNDFCNTLNTLTFVGLQNHLIQSAKRANENLKGYRLEKRLKCLRNTYEAQKRRYEVNKEKIKLGYSLQFEINHSKIGDCWRYLRYQKINECPFLLNYYKNCNIQKKSIE